MTSISYGDDVVGRLSLGTVRNIGHAMNALLAMRPPPPPPAAPVQTTPLSPPQSDSGSPSSSPELKPQDVLHDASDTLDQLLEDEGEGLEFERAVSVLDQNKPDGEPTRGERRQERRQSRREEKEKKRQAKESAKAKAPPVQKSIGLEIVQKVIRWRLTKEEHLLEEFMDIRRAMHREMQKHQEVYEDDYYHEDDTTNTVSSKAVPVLVPAGKVLWIRPTTLEKELENAETKEHPFESVLHQFEWDHPFTASSVIPTPISQQLQQHLEEDPLDSDSIRSLKSTVRSSLYRTHAVATSASSSPRIDAGSPSFSVSPPLTDASADNGSPSLTVPSSRPQSTLHRQPSLESIRTFATASTSGATSLHPTTPVATSTATHGNRSIAGQGGNTDKLIYRMYATPEPEYVFDEMLFSGRMWSDHLPLTYEFILAGKHAIPVTSSNTDKAATAKTAAEAVATH